MIINNNRLKKIVKKFLGLYKILDFLIYISSNPEAKAKRFSKLQFVKICKITLLLEKQFISWFIEMMKFISWVVKHVKIKKDCDWY